MFNLKSKSRRIGVGVGSALAALLCAVSSPALAKSVPLKIESENIVFYGDIDKDMAMDRVNKWETYRKMVYALSGIANPPADDVKLTIYGFDNTRALQEFTGRLGSGLAGVYTQGIDGPIFLTSVNEKASQEGFSEQVGLHEYTHHVLNAFVAQGFPRWYDEGFANFLSTMIIEDGKVVVGDPSAGHIKQIKLKRADWIDPETVLSAKSFYPNYTGREWRKGGPTSFYAQSMLYVHYMRNTPKYNDKLSEYLKMIEVPGVSMIEAFEQTFDISIDKFHREAARYFRNNEFITNVYQPGPAIMENEMRAERLSVAELKRAQVPGRLAFLNSRNSAEFSRDLAAITAEDPGSVDATVGYVQMDINNERYDEAVARGEAALAANPSDRKLLYAAGLARAMKTMGPQSEESRSVYKPFTVDEDLKIATMRFKEILKNDPTDFYAVNSLTRIYGNTDMEVTDEVFEAARVLDTKYMDGFNPFWGMNLAVVYAKRGFDLDACDYFQKATDETRGKKRSEVGTLKSRLEHFEKTYGQNCQFSEG